MNRGLLAITETNALMAADWAIYKKKHTETSITSRMMSTTIRHKMVENKNKKKVEWYSQLLNDEPKEWKIFYIKLN